MTLNQLKISQLATIDLIDGHVALQRLCDVLGLTPGAPITVLRRSGKSGPIQVKSLGTLFAIRAADADQIQVAVC